jgi:NTP pyrophosphatase (non-canonical NTP hydrolase)
MSDVISNGYTPNVEAGVMNAVSQGIGQWSKSKGFREDFELADKLEEIAGNLIDGSIDDLDSRQHSIDVLTTAANALRINVIGMKLMLTVSELSEALESLRDTGIIGHYEGEGNLGEEFADAKIRIDDLADMLRVSIGDEQMKKVKKNEDRPYKHGRQV